MREMTKTGWLVLFCGCHAATPPTAAPTAPAPSSPAAPEVAQVARGAPLRVGATELRPKSAIFSWREKANDLTVLITDADDPCAAISAGAWPRGATVLHATIKHNTRDNRDAHFAAGDYPLRHGTPLMPQDTKSATFLALDASCAPVTRAKATDGIVHITSTRIDIGGVAEGSFDFTMEGGEKLHGAFSATYCPPPENELQGCR